MSIYGLGLRSPEAANSSQKIDEAYSTLAKAISNVELVGSNGAAEAARRMLGNHSEIKAAAAIANEFSCAQLMDGWPGPPPICLEMGAMGRHAYEEANSLRAAFLKQARADLGTIEVM